MTSHIVKAYDAELSELDRLAAEMGGLAERLLADGMLALERLDVPLADLAIASDKQIDRLERQIQERAIAMIARRQPVANDLRQVMTVLKIAGDLERVGDLAKSIARRVSAICSEYQSRQLMIGMGHMAEMARAQLGDVLDALKMRDDAKAMAVWHGDVRLDALYNSVFRELLTYMMEDPRNIGLCTHLLFCAKNLERIGDHTTNIAENVHYLVTGSMLVDDRPKGTDANSVII